MDITNRHAVEAAFVSAYANTDDVHPLVKFEQYRIVMTHREQEPDIGATRMARRFDLPKHRIRTWIRGGKPRGYDATQTARDRGWFDLSWDSERFTAVNTLVA